MARSWNLVAHTADTGIEATGSDLPELVAAAVEGLFGSMFGDLSALADGDPVELTAGPGEPAEILVDTLVEALFRFEIDDAVLVHPVARCDEDGVLHLAAVAVGAEGLEVRGPPVKAITYHGLRVERTAAGWQAVVILDV